MEFELSEEFISQIIFSMEDQTGLYVVDSEKALLIKKTDIVLKDNQRYYDLPPWNSMTGFKMMERFVSILRNPLAREELRGVLFSGKGVFRNFKNVLKSWPEVERMWFSFKEQEMKQIVFRWYNNLRELWGLEQLEYEPEESIDLLSEDFVVRESTNADDENLFAAETTLMDELESDRDAFLGSSMAALWQHQQTLTNPENWFTLIAETVEGDFAGFLTLVPCPENSRAVMLLSTIYIIKPYRGLGLAKELLEKSIHRLREYGFLYIITGTMILSPQVISLLQRCGFKAFGSGFVLNIVEN